MTHDLWVVPISDLALWLVNCPWWLKTLCRSQSVPLGNLQTLCSRSMPQGHTSSSGGVKGHYSMLEGGDRAQVGTKGQPPYGPQLGPNPPTGRDYWKNGESARGERPDDSLCKGERETSTALATPTKAVAWSPTPSLLSSGERASRRSRSFGGSKSCVEAGKRAGFIQIDAFGIEHKRLGVSKQAPVCQEASFLPEVPRGLRRLIPRVQLPLPMDNLFSPLRQFLKDPGGFSHPRGGSLPAPQ